MKMIQADEGKKQLSGPYIFTYFIFRRTRKKVFAKLTSKILGHKEVSDNPTFSKKIMMILIIVYFFSLLMFGFVSGRTMRI